MLEKNVNRSEIKPGFAYIAEDNNKHIGFYYVLESQDTHPKFTFFSSRLSECITYCKDNSLSILNGFNHRSKGFMRYSDLIPFGHLDEVRDIRETEYNLQYPYQNPVKVILYDVYFSGEKTPWTALNLNEIAKAIMHHSEGKRCLRLPSYYSKP